MSVSLKPSSSLGFNRPFTQSVKRDLLVTNNNEQPVAFKVKTTAPKTYCVRPNSGRIEPGQTVTVQVVLQAMKEEPPLNIKCKDKFLVQSTVITPEKETMPSNELWSNVSGDDLHQQKVRVAYLPPVGQELPEEDEGPSSFVDNSRFDTIRHTPDGSPNGHAGDSTFPHFETDVHPPIERAFSPAVGDYDIPEERETHIEEPSYTPYPEHTIAPPQPQIQHHIPQSITSSEVEDLRGQLMAAQAEISRLRDLLSSIPEPSTTNDSELRRRKPFSDTATVVSNTEGETDIGTAVETAVVQQEGVPPQIVVAISLLVFILTYIFF